MSSEATWCPRCSRKRQRLIPRNPAPPVTGTGGARRRWAMGRWWWTWGATCEGERTQEIAWCPPDRQPVALDFALRGLDLVEEPAAQWLHFLRRIHPHRRIR